MAISSSLFSLALIYSVLVRSTPYSVPLSLTTQRLIVITCTCQASGHQNLQYSVQDSPQWKKADLRFAPSRRSGGQVRQLRAPLALCFFNVLSLLGVLNVSSYASLQTGLNMRLASYVLPHDVFHYHHMIDQLGRLLDDPPPFSFRVLLSILYWAPEFHAGSP